MQSLQCAVQVNLKHHKIEKEANFFYGIRQDDEGGGGGWLWAGGRGDRERVHPAPRGRDGQGGGDRCGSLVW